AKMVGCGSGPLLPASIHRIRRRQRADCTAVSAVVARSGSSEGQPAASAAKCYFSRNKVHGQEALRAIFYRRFRRRLSYRRASLILVLSALWHRRKQACTAFLYSTRVECAF